MVSLLGMGIILGATTGITVRQINLQQAVEAVFSSQIVAKAARVEELTITSDKDGFQMEALVLIFPDAGRSWSAMSWPHQRRSAVLPGATPQV